MDARATTLSENTAFAVPRGMLAEWGLSVLVERDDQRVLLDTGTSISAARNGDLLGISWGRIDAMVLSHGHYDHTGGMRDVLTKIGKRVRVIGHPDIFNEKFIQFGKDDPPRYIGIPFQRAELESLGADFQLTSKPVWLSENVVTSGEIPMITDFETIDPGLCVREKGQIVPDPLRDDQAVFVKTAPGLLVVLGCAHRGIINTLHHARNITGVETIYCVIGGTHLIRASEVQMEMTIATLREFGVQRLGVSHCTGMPAAIRLAQEFGPGFFFNNTGSVVSV
ncbi:MAG: MBL fold metallo-hydrolase [Dehalococcoidia bacterium]|nr:MBL fold metallo-hydrolase [Dehalococcoidia bacterium]